MPDVHQTIEKFRISNAIEHMYKKKFHVDALAAKIDKQNQNMPT